MRMLLAALALIVATTQQPPLTCEVFDQWIDGERFPYAVDHDGNWNLPTGATLGSSSFFGDAGVQVYYIADQNRGKIITNPEEVAPPNNDQYVIVYLSLDATQPPGERLGNHDICVYRIDG